MGQHISTIRAVGRALPSNGYEGRRQQHPDELASFLRLLYMSMLQEIGYVAAVSVDDRTVASLHNLMKSKADETGLDYTEEPVSAKGFALGLSLACVRLSIFWANIAFLAVGYGNCCG